MTTNRQQLLPRLRRAALISLALSILLFLGPALVSYPTGTATTDLHWAAFVNDACRYASTLLGTLGAALTALLLAERPHPTSLRR